MARMTSGGGSGGSSESGESTGEADAVEAAEEETRQVREAQRSARETRTTGAGEPGTGDIQDAPSSGGSGRGDPSGGGMAGPGEFGLDDPSTATESGGGDSTTDGAPRGDPTEGPGVTRGGRSGPSTTGGPADRDPTAGRDTRSRHPAEGRREPRSSEERRARNALVDEHELIDQDDVIFVERDGRTFATVDRETAALLGGVGYNPDAELASIRPGPSRAEEGGRVGETGGGEDLPVAMGGQTPSQARTDAAADVEEDLETQVGTQRAERSGVVNPVLREGIIEDVDLERGVDFTLDFDLTDRGEVATATVTEGRTQVETARAARGAEAAVIRDLEQQYGVDLDESDVSIERDGRTITGRLSESGREKVAVETSPVVETLGETPLGDEARAAASAAFDVRQFQTEQQERVDVALESAREALGISEEVDEFTAFQERQQERVDAATAEARRLLDLDADDIGTGLVTAGAVGLAAPEPVTSVAGGGAVVVGGTIIAAGAGAAAVQQAVQSDPLDRTARAEVPGLFAPEQDVPDRPASDPFVSELEVEPSSLGLSELLPPTTGQGQLRTGRITPPEIAVPTERVDRTPPELGVPDESAGQQPAELEVPTVETQQAIQRGREVSEEIRRSRSRRGRVEVPREFIPEGTVVIGGEAADERATGGGAMGITVGPNPRSTELRRIETPFGGFRVGPQLTRFLEAQERNEQVSQPELEAAVETDRGTPGDSVPGLFGLGAGAADGVERRREAASTAVARPGSALEQLMAVRARGGTLPDRRLAAVQQSRLALLTGQATAPDARAVEDVDVGLLAGTTAGQAQRSGQAQAQDARQQQATGQRAATDVMNRLVNPPAEATAQPPGFGEATVEENVFERPAETVPARGGPRRLLGLDLPEGDERPRARRPSNLLDRTFGFEFLNPLAPVDSPQDTGAVDDLFGSVQPRRRRRDDGLTSLFGGDPAAGIDIPGFTDGDGREGGSRLEELFGGFL